MAAEFKASNELSGTMNTCGTSATVRDVSGLSLISAFRGHLFSRRYTVKSLAYRQDTAPKDASKLAAALIGLREVVSRY
jgi:hypothetical protein